MPNQPNFPIPSEVNPEGTRCICIPVPDNDDWIRVFVGLLAQPTYWFNWQRDNEKKGKDCAAVWTKLFDTIDWSIMSCCCPDDINSSTNNILNIQLSLQLQQLDDGTVGSYAPDAPDTTFSTDSRDTTPEEMAATVATLCQACNSWVRQVLSDQLNATATTALEASSIGIAVGLINPIAGAIIALAGSLPYATWLEVANDHDAVDEVVCYMFKQLQGEDPTFANFEGCLSAFSSSNSNATNLAHAVDQSNHDKRNFRAFMVYLQAKVGGDYSGCDSCEDCPTVYNWETGNTVVIPDAECVYNVSSTDQGGGVHGVYLGALTNPPTFPTTDGFKVLDSHASTFIVTVGYYNLDGSVVTGHGPDPSAKVAAVFFETNTPFTADFTLIA